MKTVTKKERLDDKKKMRQTFWLFDKNIQNGGKLFNAND